MRIADFDIHLWLVYTEKVQKLNLFGAYLYVLNEEEKSRYKRFCFDKHRHQYLIARALVRNVLSLYNPYVRPAEWLFRSNKFGKPYIDNEAFPVNINFNLSHTNEIIVLAISTQSVMGVDVENIHRESKIMDIADNCFTAEEIIFLNKDPLDQRPKRFFDLWTLKEAYVKAKGKGLSLPLNQFSFLLDGNNISIKFNSDYSECADAWKFWQFQPDCSHVLSLAIKSSHMQHRYLVTMRELLL